MSIRFESEDHTPLPTARPGQYLTLRLPDAGDPAPLRSYSLSGSGGEYRISVKREDHGVVSRWLHDNIRPGSVVDVAAPRGDFYLSDGAGPVVLMSAGVGVTPVLAMLHALAKGRSDREVWWLHITRDAETHAFSEEVSDLIAELPHARQQVFYTSSVGRLDARAVAELGLPQDATVYMCGPDQFMADMRSALTDAGIDPAQIHTELFACPASDQSRHRRQVDGAAASALRPGGHGAAGVVLPQRAHGQLVLGLWQHPRARRGLRRPDAILVPQRGLPYLRHPAHRRNNGLHPAPSGAAARRDRADLYRRANRRNRAGPVARSPFVGGSN